MPTARFMRLEIPYEATPEYQFTPQTSESAKALAKLPIYYSPSRAIAQAGAAMRLRRRQRFYPNIALDWAA
jgi:hypothetical protein